jgi:TonB family protein
MRALYSPAWIGSLVAAAVLTAAAATAQDRDLSAARELYASAAYEDALAALNRLRSSDHPPSQSPIIEQYRAFCLLALGRASDAEQAIEAAVTADPSYHPADSDVSPRIRTTFTEVRRRMLPVIIQQKYTQAKAAYDRKDYAAAASGFSQVLATMADPDVASEASRSPLSDMRVLALGFQELSAKAAAPPPAPLPVVQAAPPPPPPVAPAAPPVPRIYTPEDRTVVPPQVINQTLPGFRGVTPVERIGRIEVVIDETGAVESAVMTMSVNSTYDKMALAAARTWRYVPAKVDGTPVKFKKIVQVTVRPTT